MCHRAETDHATIAMNDYSSGSEWEYVSEAGNEDAHIIFTITMQDINVGTDIGRVFGVGLGLVSPDVGLGGDVTFMQASRKLLFTIDYTDMDASQPILFDKRLVFEFCANSLAQCNSLPGWASPRARMEDIVDDSDGNCNSNRAIVQSITSSLTGQRQDLTLVLKLYEDAFQTCSGSMNDNAGLFGLGFTPGQPTRLVYTAFVLQELSDAIDNDPFITNFHQFWWRKGFPTFDPFEFFLTIGEPTATPTRRPTNNPTTPEPTRNPTTPEPTRNPTTGVPSATPTKYPTDVPTATPTGRPSETPTKFPTNVPTATPTGRPSETPTKRPTFGPTTPTPSASPTLRPSFSPTKPLVCPDEFDWIRCSNVNTMYKFANAENRPNLIRSMCNSDRFNNICYWCENGKKSLSGCRPRRAFDTQENQPYLSVCQPEEDPFFEPSMGCEQFKNCPSPQVMSGCRSVNDLELGARWRRKRPCREGFEYRGYQIQAGDCVWCNGVCRAAQGYQPVTHVLCRIPLLFDIIRACPGLDGPFSPP